MTPLLPHPHSLHLAVTICLFSLPSSSILGTHVDEEHEEIITKLVGLPHLIPGVWMHGSWNSSTEYCGGVPSSGKVDATFCLLHRGCVSVGECGFPSFIFSAKSLFAAWTRAPWLQKKMPSWKNDFFTSSCWCFYRLLQLTSFLLCILTLIKGLRSKVS